MPTLGFNRLGSFGRSGNQMFQIAAVLGVSEKTGHTPIANLSNSTLPDGFELIGVEDAVVTEGGVYFEKDFSYNEEINSIPSDINVNLEGYYQSEKYFKHCENKIRDLFTFKESIRERAAFLLPEGVSTSLHVRKTDYVQLSHTHFNQTDEYYEQALQKHNDYYGQNVTPVVFSDDITWCRENMKWLPAETIYMSNDIFVDMCLMSWCSSHIIANSSFSWWAAWLGRGRTIAPKMWFAENGPKNWQDIYCDHWEVL